uniref:Putative DNA-binding BolA family transcriptional regulator n=1 Tax=Serratia marcescens TaxID=615 RepID=V5YVZ7_SERMA|nr:putative DNA-binding BolA family transcriptional regulator [Serratia marcescens]
MNAVVRNVFHQRCVNRLLFFDAAHAGEQFTDHNRLKMATVARHMYFIQCQCLHQHVFNLVGFHSIQFCR